MNRLFVLWPKVRILDTENGSSLNRGKRPFHLRFKYQKQRGRECQSSEADLGGSRSRRDISSLTIDHPPSLPSVFRSQFFILSSFASFSFRYSFVIDLISSLRFYLRLHAIFLPARFTQRVLVLPWKDFNVEFIYVEGMSNTSSIWFH